ncbi:MAG: M1 family metallopeptidase [Actinomycetota bacterium]|nr:M1 family metallopeptidase [Actinomycetota bacterium]
MRARGLTVLSVVFVVSTTMVACTSDPGVRSARADPAISGPATVPPPETTPAPPGTTTPSAPSTVPMPASTVPGMVPTDDGAGDLLFPSLGNPGIDVLHYDVGISYDPDRDAIDGVVGLDLLLTEPRAEITLDAVNLKTWEVTVNGQAVAAQDDSPELRIPLPTPGAAGEQLRVEVTYSVEPSPMDSPIGFPNSWFNTEGGSYVLNEPDGARGWMPCNDHPSDKASYTFTVRVPAGTVAVANGELVEQRNDGALDVWVWQEDRPMTTYLILLLTGDYEIITDTGPDGLPLIHAVLRSDVEQMQPYLDITPEMIEFFDDLFGPYPLDRYGLAFSDSFGGLAMETQERSLFSRDDFTGEMGEYQETFLAHELVHQYYGNAVSPARWQDIWLNESFATYGEWLWMEHAGYFTVDDQANLVLAQRPPGSSADPSVQEMFGFNSYMGGAIVLHALRLTVGDDAFFEMLRRWAAENNGESRTTQQFITFAEESTGQSLTDFFDTWLFADRPPDEFPNG